MPASLQDLLTARLAALPADALDVLLAAACLRSPTVTMLEQAVGPSALAALREAGRSRNQKTVPAKVKTGRPIPARSSSPAASPRPPPATTATPIRDLRSSSYLGTFEPAAAFSQLVDAEARRRGSEHIRQLVVLGGGAAWIWNIADELVPAATQIVDLFHAREHVHDLATLATRLLRSDGPAWLAGRLAELGAGNIPGLLAAGRALKFIGSLARERDKQLGYFEVNAHRMRYAHFRDLGMFIGSGAVEAGCKAVIGHRLKLSGMRWNIPGATAIATLRCH